MSDLTPLAGLTALTELDVSWNQVSDLTPLVGLSALTELNVWFNQISDLTPLAGLTALKKLDIRENKIVSLPRRLAEMTTEIYWEEPHKFANRETGLNLYDNPLESPPVEIVKQGKQAVLAWFRAGDKFPLNEVKVLLVGDGSAGKTSLVKRLLGEPFNRHEPQTHGILIRDWKIAPHPPAPSPKRRGGEDVLPSPIGEGLGERSPIKIHFWDFGGQEIMHATHQFFLSKRSLYILVLDGRKDEKTEYWLKHIESSAAARRFW